MTKLTDESAYIESTLTSKPPRIGKKGNKVLLKVDNLRMSCYPLLEEDENYLEGHPMFEVLEYWQGKLDQPYSPGDLEILNQLTDGNKVVELRLGNYEVMSQWNKRLK